MAHRDATNIEAGEIDLGSSLPLQPPGKVVEVSTAAMSDNWFFHLVSCMYYAETRTVLQEEE